MSEKVMNINHLRKLILSYFRKKTTRIICDTCKLECLKNYTKVYIWDDTVFYYQCLNCYNKEGYRMTLGY